MNELERTNETNRPSVIERVRALHAEAAKLGEEVTALEHASAEQKAKVLHAKADLDDTDRQIQARATQMRLLEQEAHNIEHRHTMVQFEPPPSATRRRGKKSK